MPEKTLKLYPLPEREQPGGTEIYKDLELPESGRGDMSRPYVFINMISSLDGNTNMKGKASGMGTLVDRRVMRTLRSKADAVMIGAGTLRAEKLSLGLDDDDPGPRPLAVILTSTGDVPTESNLVRDERQKVVILLADSATEAASAHLSVMAEVTRVPTTASGSVDLASAIEILKTQYAVDRLLIEGGPTLNHALISSCLADEIFITLAPALLGKSDPDVSAILDGPLNEPQTLRLLSAYFADNELFLRYALTAT